MYLYSKVNENGVKNTINVYECKPNNERLSKYKEKKMENIPKDKCIYTAKTNDPNNYILKETNHMAYESISQNVYTPAFNSLNSFNLSKKSYESQLELLKRYYEGCFINNRIIKVFNFPEEDTPAYFLITQNDNTYNLDKKGYYKIEDIIKIPSELYLLQYIENAVTSDNPFIFKDLLKYDISEQLQAFDIKKVDIIKIEELKKIIQYHLISRGEAPYIEESINICEKVLTKRGI